jgi:uncharacterized membrane protein
VFEWVFRLLFRYQPLVFQQGTFVWGVSRAMWAAVILAAGLAVYAILTYRGLTGLASRDRRVLFAIRISALLVVLFCLLRPTIVIKEAVPQQNFVGVLLDDSRSMQIADRQGKPRSEYITGNLAKPDSPLIAKLSEKFVVRTFRFSQVAERLQAAGDLTFAGTGTHLGDALARARDELAGLPLSGLVMVTDGGDTSEATLDESVQAMKAASIPVFTIGVGQDRLTRDIQVSRIEAPRTVLKGTALVVDAIVTQNGYAGAKVPIQIESDGRLVSTQDITLPGDGESATVHVHFTAAETGARVYRIRVPVQPGEQVTENNSRDTLIEVVDRKEKILYIEGEPRYDMKFIKQAAAEDPNLQIVVLQRTATDKFLRLGVDKPEELVGGFPTTEEELFAYRGLILGSVEASAFTVDQLRMINNFVSRRGGGLLALGGRRAFAEGGWGGTPVAEALPVAIEATGGVKTAAYFSALTITPARAGASHPVTQIAATEPDSAARWPKMPPVSTVNPIHAVKPGATVLLSGADDRGKDQVVLAWQRYGRGKSIAFPVQDSYLWRMMLAVTETTHHTFFQRLGRWLVDGVPGPVEVTLSPDHVEPKEPVTLAAWVTDAKYIDVNDGKVVAHVTAPSGKAVDVPMDWTVRRDGEYKATFTPDEEGLYGVSVGASRAGKELGTSIAHVRAAPSDREYFDAAMRAPLLKRLSEETGGRFFTADNTKTLVDAISYSGRGVTVVLEKNLWDLPIVFLLLIALLGGEWTYRRARGLA